MRLIDADALINVLKDPPVHASLCGMTMADVLSLVDEAPTIDAEPSRHGKRLHPEEEDEDRHTVSWSCSVCGGKFTFYEDDLDRAPYCPVCGEKMGEAEP